MFGVHPRSDGRYPGRHAAETRKAAREKGVKADYYSRAVEAGEPPGEWLGPGLSDLGLSLGAEVSQDQMDVIYTRLRHPETGAQLGRKVPSFAGPAENLALVAQRHGIELPPDCQPTAVREAIEARRVTDRQIERRIASHLEPEEARAFKREAAQIKVKHPSTFLDLTASPDKSWSVFQAAAEACERFDVAAEVDAAQRDGGEAMLAYLRREAGFSRVGSGGVGQIDADRWIIAAFQHHLSREGDPQLHWHYELLNRVKCPDGEWRSVDARMIFQARPETAAVYERVSEESLSRRLGVRFETSPDGKSRRIVGVPEDAIRLFSKRAAAIEARLDEWAKKWEADHGQAPTPRERDIQSRRFSAQNRKSKPAEMEARPDTLAAWDKEYSKEKGQTLREVFEGVMERCLGPTQPLASGERSTKTT